MSMISTQIDELRRLASTLDTRYRYAEDIATALREAADTISELRGDLQRTNDAVRDAEHDESRAWDRVRKAEAENAKLVRVLHEVEREAILAYKHLQKDCETMTASASHYFEKWWHSECQNDKLKAKNAKLRTQLADVTESMGRVEERHAKTFEVGKRWMAKAARFEAENAKLLEIIADLEELLPESKRWHNHETVKAIANDNAKLRKLVKDMFRDFTNADDELRQRHGRTFMARTRYEPRLRELGMEVS